MIRFQAVPSLNSQTSQFSQMSLFITCELSKEHPKRRGDIQTLDYLEFWIWVVTLYLKATTVNKKNN